ncbi:hypothetical protein FHW67_003863, partial [Herbaspirillum sp. Sphag1AN]|uniref:ESPR-type extended signal peptide-containing protein n=1 Tax=unclassified Herbaspirillum TaxID=2624150 RepID=UPI001614D6BA
MNQQRYRLIFNAHRGATMAVAENVSSHAGGSGISAIRAGTRPDSSTPAAASGSAPLRLARLGVMIAFLCGSVISGMSAVQAQIVADPNAAGAQRPVIDNTANGLPLVQIAAPNASGLSHNQ